MVQKSGNCCARFLCHQPSLCLMSEIKFEYQAKQPTVRSVYLETTFSACSKPYSESSGVLSDQSLQSRPIGRTIGSCSQVNRAHFSRFLSLPPSKSADVRLSLYLFPSIQLSSFCCFALCCPLASSSFSCCSLFVPCRLAFFSSSSSSPR